MKWLLKTVRSTPKSNKRESCTRTLAGNLNLINMKKLLFLALSMGFMAACSTDEPTKTENATPKADESITSRDFYATLPSGDPDLYNMMREVQRQYGGGPRFYITSQCSWGNSINGGACGYVNGIYVVSYHLGLPQQPGSNDYTVTYYTSHDPAKCLCD